jgi:hypothetical protein
MRRDRAYARRNCLGGSGATTHYVLPRRIRFHSLLPEGCIILLDMATGPLGHVPADRR